MDMHDRQLPTVLAKEGVVCDELAFVLLDEVRQPPNGVL